ncbi:MAG: Methyltransferase domain, partial [Bacteroidota bacterium]
LYLLDIGCGQGNLLYQVKDSFPKWHLFGGDLSPAEIEECIKQSRLKAVSAQVRSID